MLSIRKIKIKKVVKFVRRKIKATKRKLIHDEDIAPLPSSEKRRHSHDEDEAPLPSSEKWRHSHDEDITPLPSSEKRRHSHDEDIASLMNRINSTKLTKTNSLANFSAEHDEAVSKSVPIERSNLLKASINEESSATSSKKHQGRWYSARLYRSPNREGVISAMFCICLCDGMYIKHCDSIMKEKFSGELSWEFAQDVQDCIEVYSDDKYVMFDKTPAQILKKDIHIPEVMGAESDVGGYPPRLLITAQTNSDFTSPKICVKGLDRKCGFNLFIPVSSSSTPSDESGTKSRAREPLSSAAQSVDVQRPTLREFINFPMLSGKVNLAQKINCFQNFGIIILEDDDGDRIDAIMREHRDRAEDINKGVFRLWVKGEGLKPVSWATLLDVLQDIGLNTLARDIKQVKYPMS